MWAFSLFLSSLLNKTVLINSKKKGERRSVNTTSWERGLVVVKREELPSEGKRILNEFILNDMKKLNR
jgi:hypothetical protein